MAFIAIMLSAPVVAVSLGGLVYDIFWLGHGIKDNDAAVRLLLGLIAASTGGLAASQFSKRTLSEMLGKVVPGVEASARPPGPRGPKEQGE